jgi:hypothetical protein
MDKIGPCSTTLSNFLWSGLTKETRAVYHSGQKAWETFTRMNGFTAYPASELGLGEFICSRAVGSGGVTRVSPDTIQANLSAIKSTHVDRRLESFVFDSLWIKRILAGVRRCYSSPRSKQAEPMTEEVLQRITDVDMTNLQQLNFSVASIVAFAGFLRMGEFTIKDSQTKETPEVYQQTRLTRSDVTFGADGSHAILRLKRSKSDVDHHGVDVLLSASPGSPTCPVTALRKLFDTQPLPDTAPLFGWGSKPLKRTWMINNMRSKLRNEGISVSAKYSGHSFRRGAAQKAYDNGLTEADIQALGRWTSDAFKRYYSQSLQQRLDLNRRFLSRTSRLLSPPPSPSSSLPSGAAR